LKIYIVINHNLSTMVSTMIIEGMAIARVSWSKNSNRNKIKVMNSPFWKNL